MDKKMIKGIINVAVLCIFVLCMFTSCSDNDYYVPESPQYQQERKDFDEDYEEKVEEYAKSIVSSEIKSHNQQYASVDCYTGTIEKKSEDRYVVNGKAYIDDKYGELMGTATYSVDVNVDDDGDCSTPWSPKIEYNHY